MADDNTKSIRRIMKGVKDDPTGLGLADDYKGIGTSRGEAFINSRGDVTGSGSNGSGDDINQQPPSSTPDTGTPDDNDTGASGGVNSGSDPADALNGDVDDVDAATTTNSQIGTVTGTDTATGNITSLNINTLEGIEYIPPATWDSPESEGVADTVGSAPTCVSIGCPATNEKGDRGATQWDSSSGFTYTIGYFDFNPPSTPIPPPGFDTIVNNCTNCPLDAEAEAFPQLFRTSTTTSEPPPITDEDWPSDSNCQVVYDESEGGYKGNELDPDCSAAQILPTDFVIIRSVSDPSKYYRYTKLANGGTKITLVDAGGVPVPSSITKTTDEGGRVNGFFDVSLDASII